MLLGRLAIAGIMTSTLLALACASCTSTDSAPIAVADAGVGEDADVESDAEPPAPVGDGNTGSPCAVDDDCKQGTCILTLNGHAYPQGYCSMGCVGSISTCPGTGAFCEPTSKRCLAGCTDKQGARPCRSGYLCTYVTNDSKGACLPENYSQCDVSKRGSCSAGLVCTIAGYDPVGRCDKGCDLFAQDCPSASAGCYPTAVGEGHCADLHASGADGDPCKYTNDCAPGLSCNDEGSTRACRPLCGGPTKKACTNGKKCVDLSPSTDVTIAGICAG